jgi:anti-sigma-K factor RskA
VGGAAVARHVNLVSEGARMSENNGMEVQGEMFAPEYDLAGYILGALDSNETARVRSAVAADDGLRAELAELEIVLAALGQAVPRQPINRGRSAGIRSRLIARAASAGDRRIPFARQTSEIVRPRVGVGATTTAKTQPSQDTQRSAPSVAATQATPTPVYPHPVPRPSGAIRGSVWVGLAVILSAIVGGVQEWRLRKGQSEVRAAAAARDSVLTDQVATLQASVAAKDSFIESLIGPNVKIIDLVSATASSNASARMFWDQKTHEWTMRAYRLRQPQPGKTFQVWLIATNNPIPISAGTFEPDMQGNATFHAKQDLSKGSLIRIAVTEEPLGGVAYPMGPLVVAGK